MGAHPTGDHIGDGGSACGPTGDEADHPSGRHLDGGPDADRLQRPLPQASAPARSRDPLHDGAGTGTGGIGQTRLVQVDLEERQLTPELQAACGLHQPGQVDEQAGQAGLVGWGGLDGQRDPDQHGRRRHHADHANPHPTRSAGATFVTR